MTEITKPHDRFFKAVFSRPEVAENFALNFLPPNVTGHLKPNSFRPSQGSFVDERLKEHSSDLLYEADFKDGRKTYVYLLFEHKSSPDLNVAYQLLRYLTRIWEHTTEGGKGASYMESILDRWMNEGVEKGMQQGMLREAASLTIRLLTRRFGKLDEATEERIRRLPLEDVERLGEELLDFPDKSALREWLDGAAR